MTGIEPVHWGLFKCVANSTIANRLEILIMHHAAFWGKNVTGISIFLTLTKSRQGLHVKFSIRQELKTTSTNQES